MSFMVSHIQHGQIFNRQFEKEGKNSQDVNNSYINF